MISRPCDSTSGNLNKTSVREKSRGVFMAIVGFQMTSLKFKLKNYHRILPRFYFHDALEQLKTNFHTNFCFKRVLGFVVEYA